MKVAAEFLARRIAYDVSTQDLRLDRSGLPALPWSRLIISNVRLEPQRENWPARHIERAQP